MAEKTLKATHRGVIDKFGELKIPCVVLEDGKRLLTQGGFLTTIGRSRTPKGGTGVTVAEIPTFLAADNLKSYIDDDLRISTIPIRYFIGKSTRYGYRAELLPQICEVYLKARDNNELRGRQKNIAERADVIIRALAHIGIIALVDEATGYQEIRDRKALQKILEKYLLKEHAKWAKRFPDEFYQRIFDLKNWQWKGMKVNRPSVVGKYTKDLVYERLAPGVLAELEKLNPPNEKGVRKSRHHQWLTEDIGHPDLQRHLAMLIALMRAASNWGKFMRSVERALPKKGDMIPLPIDED